MDFERLNEIAQLLRLPPNLLRNMSLTDLEYDGPCDAFSKARTRTILACTARSGSSVICAELKRYGFQFAEYLNPKGNIRRIRDTLAEQTSSSLAQEVASKAIVDGHLAIKMPVEALAYLVLWGEFSRLDQWKFVYLQRNDIIRQAISAQIAASTGQWTHDMVKTGEVSEDDYDFEAIYNLCTAFMNANQMWERFFLLADIEPYRITYEQYLADRKGVISSVANWIGADNAQPPQPEAPLSLEPQATELNSNWEKRFRTEARARLTDSSFSLGDG